MCQYHDCSCCCCIAKLSLDSTQLLLLVHQDTDAETMWSVQEAREVLKSYIDDHELVHSEDKALVVLDPLLCDMLYRLSKKEAKAGVQEGGFPTEDSKRNVFNRFEKHLEAYHMIEGGLGKKMWRKGMPSPVQVSQEKVKGHNITRVVGLETFGIVPEELAADAKRLFACTTTVTALSGRNSTGKEVQMQGHLADRLFEHIHRDHGVDRKHINVKKSGKAKGK